MHRSSEGGRKQNFDVYSLHEFYSLQDRIVFIHPEHLEEIKIIYQPLKVNGFEQNRLMGSSFQHLNGNQDNQNTHKKFLIFFLLLKVDL